MYAITEEGQHYSIVFTYQDSAIEIEPGRPTWEHGSSQEKRELKCDLRRR